MYQDRFMTPRAFRLLVLLAAVLFLAIAFILPGPGAFAAGLAGFHLLPLVLRPRIGATTRTAEALVVVTSRTDGDRTLTALRFWGIFLALAYALVGHGEPVLTSGMVSVGLMSAVVLAIALPMFLLRVFSRRILAETIHLERTTLTLHGRAGPRVVRYADIARIEQSGSELTIVTDSGRIAIPVNGREPKALRIKTEIEAARVLAAEPVTESLAELRRPSGMSMREWLQRLDALAATSRAGGYRGSALDPETLWRVLADEDAERDVRTGAARVLSADALPETRLRIKESGARLGEELVHATAEDIDDAVTGLEAAEQETLRRLAGM